MDKNIEEKARYIRRIPVGSNQGVEYTKEADQVNTEPDFGNESCRDNEFAGDSIGRVDQDDAEARRRSILAGQRQRN